MRRATKSQTVQDWRPLPSGLGPLSGDARQNTNTHLPPPGRDEPSKDPRPDHEQVIRGGSRVSLRRHCPEARSASAQPRVTSQRTPCTKVGRWFTPPRPPVTPGWGSAGTDAKAGCGRAEECRNRAPPTGKHRHRSRFCHSRAESATLHWRARLGRLWTQLGTQHVLHPENCPAGGGGRRPRPGATEWGAMRGAGEMGEDRRHLKVMTLASTR